MAILATLIGGVTGFISVVCAVFIFDISVLRALALYAAVGISLTLALIGASLCWGLKLRIATLFWASVPSVHAKERGAGKQIPYDGLPRESRSITNGDATVGLAPNP